MIPLPKMFNSPRDSTSSRLPGCSRWLLPLLALTGIQSAWCESLSDPTLAPPAWLAAQQVERGDSVLAGPEAPAEVQVIVIGKSRKLAVVDGRVVKPGDTYNGSKVLDIKSGAVVVRDASKSLKLTPAVEKKVITSPSLGTTEKTTSKHKNLVKSPGGTQ